VSRTIQAPSPPQPRAEEAFARLGGLLGHVEPRPPVVTLLQWLLRFGFMAWRRGGWGCGRDDGGVARDFRPVDRDTPMLLSPDLRDWLPAEHLAWLVIEVVQACELSSIFGGEGLVGGPMILGC
jgi:hypothetical protein